MIVQLIPYPAAYFVKPLRFGNVAWLRNIARQATQLGQRELKPKFFKNLRKAGNCLLKSSSHEGVGLRLRTDQLVSTLSYLAAHRVVGRKQSGYRPQIPRRIGNLFMRQRAAEAAHVHGHANALEGLAERHEPSCV